MFFEKPVGAAITASEIDEFARPIGKKEASSEPRCAIFSLVRANVRVCTYTRRIRGLFLRDRRSCYSTNDGEFRWL